MSEIWKSIPSYPSLEASSLGRIRLRENRPNYRWKTGGSFHPKGFIYTPTEKNGYLIIRLTINKKRKQLLINRLVCEAFHGIPPTLEHYALHKNGKEKENFPSNLYWGTQKQNTDDRERHGNTSRGEHRYNAQIDNKKVRLIRILAEEGFTSKEISKKLNVSIHIINDIRSGKSWKAA